MPAWAVGLWTSSYCGSSNWPLKKGTGSWQPAHQREARVPMRRRVSRTLNRYAGLLNELNLWAECRWLLKMSAWHFRQYSSFISAAAGMKLASTVRDRDGSKY